MLDQDYTHYPNQVPLPRPLGYQFRQPETRFGLALTGITTAGAIHGGVVVGILFCFRLLVSGMPTQDLSELFCGFVAGICLLGMIAMLYLAVLVLPLAIMSLGLCLVIVRTLGVKVRWSVLGGFGGGLTGYIGTCWLLARASSPSWESALTIVLGPLLATLLGQAGGAWPALAPWVKEEGADPYHQDETQSVLRFDIRQLLIATAWAASILAVLKGLGALGVGSASVLFGGLVFQVASLPLVLRVVKGIRQR
ncbi:hypothetical protein NG895_01140 [Aeoliella sp. ICT_H6.2]|uniref:Uncharacterized protein n=1 Tax=Aeoliella straminimaris TaxID=2954799 RepID=A0A9X2FAP4_9BACT|nr:hypothetical protein [Aeoliella straminimaris]MCO6042501.1 hypothetical protein [Aeoliella straminimaris]